MMKQMIAPRSIVMVQPLMVAGPGLVPALTRTWGRGVSKPRGAYGSINSMLESFMWVRWTVP